MLIVEFHNYPQGWVKLFAEAGYTYGYCWTIIK